MNEVMQEFSRGMDIRDFLHFGDLALRIRLSSDSNFANLQILELLSTFELGATVPIQYTY